MKYTEKDRLRSLKRKESVIAIIFFEGIYSRFALWLANNTNITPNQLSFLNFITILFASFLFLNGYFIFGGIVSLVSYILDSTDGHLARIKDMTTFKGMFIDLTIDMVGNLLLSFSISFFLFSINKNLYSFLLAVVYPFTCAFEVATGFMTRYAGKPPLSHISSKSRFIFVPLQSDFNLAIFFVLPVFNIKNPIFYSIFALLYFFEIMLSVIIKILRYK